MKQHTEARLKGFAGYNCLTDSTTNSQKYQMMLMGNTCVFNETHERYFTVQCVEAVGSSGYQYCINNIIDDWLKSQALIFLFN